MLRLNLICGFAAVVLASSAEGQPVPAITKEQAHIVVVEVERLITEHYVFPEKRQSIVDALKAADAAGHYDTTDPGELSEHLTNDLRAAGNDRHLRVGFQPDMYAELLKPGSHDDSDLMRKRERRHNDGYEEQRVLPGNVRYVRISGFMWSKDRTPPVIDAAARFLSEGDAIIFDLRGNGGGDADAVERMISYFFPPGSKQELMSFYDGLTGRTAVNHVVSVPGARLTGRPVYVLIDDSTASAAEEFTYHMQQFKLATLVGRKTAGGANNNTFYPIAPGFVASISVGRPIHPISHTNWEGVGIAPDVEVAPEHALEQAQILALRTLLAGATGPDRTAFAWAIDGLQARVAPVQLSPQEMQAYVGTYGIRKVWIADGVLHYQREGLPVTTLIPMGNDTFAFSHTDEVRVRFRRKDGRVIGFDQLFDNGETLPSERTA